MPRYVRYQLCWSEEVHAYELFIDGLPSEQEFTMQWLETTASFSFRSRHGGVYTVRKQAVQRGGTYWYGYRRLHGRLVKHYVGKTTDLSVSHLEKVAHLFFTETSFLPEHSPARPSSEPAEPHLSETLLLFSKLSPPRLPHPLVERSALLARLDTGLSYPLMLIQAPAGFGKTTLVAQWLVEHHTHIFPRAAWLFLDTSDNDSLRFLRSCILACQQLEPTVGQAALAQLSHALEPPFQLPPLETILTSFLHDLAQHVSDGLLILDDYHTIKEPRIHEMLTFFIDHLPFTLHVLLLSRSEPPLPLVRWRAKGVLLELQRADLRFSLEETAAFLHQQLLPPLSDAALRQIDASLEGWAVGLRLFAHTQQGKRSELMVTQTLISLSDNACDGDVETHASQVRQQILDYFVTEILHTQPKPLQHFLLSTSILSHLNTSLCDAVTHEGNSAAQLKAIEQAGLFLEGIDAEMLHLQQDTQVWYRYHALWALALRREASSCLGEKMLRTLLLRASRWYEQHGMLMEAIEMALQAHDLERSAQLIEHADRHERISDPYTLHRWLSPMPESVIREHPMLCWLLALSLQLLQDTPSMLTGGRERVEVLLQMAEEGWRNRGAFPFLGLIPAFHALSAWRKSLFPDAEEYAQLALAQLGDEQQNRRTRLFRGICLFLVGVAQMYVGRFDTAQPLLLEAYTCSLIDRDKHFTRGLLLLLGVCSYAQGELYQAQEYYRQALSDARTQKDNEVLAQSLLGLATLAFEWNHLSHAQSQVDEAMVYAREEDTDLRDRIDLLRALLSYAQGQLIVAGQRLAALQVRLHMTATPQSIHLLPEVRLWQARLALEAGDLQNAARLVATLDAEASMPPRIFHARLLLAQKKPEAAHQQLERLLPNALEWRHILEIHVLLALAYASCQEEGPSQEHLGRALSQAHREGLIRPFLSEGMQIASLLRQYVRALQESVLRSYVLTLLRAFQIANGEDTSNALSPKHLLLEPLSPQEQRVLTLLVTGRSNKEIAQELVISINTLKDHLKHIYRKLGVTTRLQASSAAYHLNLL